ncbi:ribonuclease YeeF family protein [Listeria welshimeri]|nr:ribonuclease YeeF family protein [Listeria welshimeri]
MEEAEADIQELDSDGAISFQHTNHTGKYSTIEEDLLVLYKFCCHAGERMENLVNLPFYEKLDAFVGGMQELSISTYATTNRMEVKEQRTVTTGEYAQSFETIKAEVTMEDLLNGDNFYANQMQLQYRDWKRANPDQDVSEADFKMSMIHTRAFEYKSIKNEQEEKEFWVSIVATVGIIAVSVLCPPAGLALSVAYGGLEISSAVSGKDWFSGRELSTGERYTRAGFGVLDVIPGVKAFTTGAKAVGTGSKLLRLGDNVLADSKNIGRLAKGTMGEGLQAGKQAMHLRLSNAQKIAQQAGANVQRKLAKDWNDLGAAAKAIQGKAKQAIPLAPRERLALAGAGGSIPEQSAAGASAAATKKKLQEMMQKMDNLNVKGSGESGIIKKASGANRPQTLEEFLKEMDELPRARISKKVEDGLVSTPTGKRLAPSVYMSKAEIEAHLSLFDDGVVRVQSKENFDFAINTYGPNIGDPKTGTYVMPKSVADKAISVADGNPRILEELLGLEPMSLGENPVLLDIQKTTNIRVPSGNESGAWQGLWEPGGFTNGGIPEAVVDTIKSDEYIVKNVFK